MPASFAIDATECLNPCNVICGSSLVIMHLRKREERQPGLTGLPVSSTST